MQSAVPSHPAASGGYKVDVSRGERIGRVSSEWFSRPDDERYLSLSSLHDAVRARADRATARTVETRSLRVEASRDNAERLSDAISIHMVLSPRSRGIVGAEDIGRLKHGAILINTSRGTLVDEAALVAAVRAGRIVAALDVFDKEPLPKGHPLRAEGSTVLTPHLGYGVAETWRDFYPKSVENALAFLNGTPIRVVGPS